MNDHEIINMTSGTELPPESAKKLSRLREYIKDLGSLAVGFSGGVDSTFLISAAHEVLGDKAVAVTVAAAFMPENETAEAEAFCKERGIRQIICRFDPLKIDACRYNAPDRCYHCKHAIFTEIKKIAAANGIAYTAEGSNMDDLSDYRPGLRAVDELSVVSPLREADLYKSDIRIISKYMGLPTWSKPSYACLASRFTYGEEITEEKLRMVERAEQFLISIGFPEERVRLHGRIARIEVPARDIPSLASDDIRSSIHEEFTKLGFQYVTLDLLGYRTGSMNSDIM